MMPPTDRKRPMATDDEDSLAAKRTKEKAAEAEENELRWAPLGSNLRRRPDGALPADLTFEPHCEQCGRQFG